MNKASKIIVDLAPISTAREHCLALKTGPVDGDIVDQAERSRFDQLPIVNGDGLLCGLMETSRARALYLSGKDLTLQSPGLRMREVAPSVELNELLALLADARAVVLRERFEPQADDINWFALVTISDLNRHPFRSLLYSPIVNLEIALAELIDLYFDDPWDWLTLTGQNSIIRIVGRWEVEKRANVDTHPVTGCTLTDMVNVVGKTAALWAKLGFPSKSKYDDTTGSFADLRNQIMHPVRSLIRSVADVNSLQKNIASCVALTDRVSVLNSELHETTARKIRYLP